MQRPASTAAWLPDAARDLGRAVGGSLLFATPLLMTLEVWQHAVTMTPARVVSLLGAVSMLLVGLARVSGWKDAGDETFLDIVIDAGVAVAVGSVVSAVLLATFGSLDLDLGASAVARRVALGAAPASLGAVLARSQLVAPTDEIALIAFAAGPAGTVVLLGLSVVAMHVLVYRVEFAGSHDSTDEEVVRFTLTGYALVALTSAFLLWVFGRADGVSAEVFARQVVVLSFPGALGAAVGRLVL